MDVNVATNWIYLLRLLRSCLARLGVAGGEKGVVQMGQLLLRRVRGADQTGDAVGAQGAARGRREVLGVVERRREVVGGRALRRRFSAIPRARPGRDSGGES